MNDIVFNNFQLDPIRTNEFVFPVGNFADIGLTDSSCSKSYSDTEVTKFKIIYAMLNKSIQADNFNVIKKYSPPTINYNDIIPDNSGSKNINKQNINYPFINQSNMPVDNIINKKKIKEIKIKEIITENNEIDNEINTVKNRNNNKTNVINEISKINEKNGQVENVKYIELQDFINNYNNFMNMTIDLYNNISSNYNNNFNFNLQKLNHNPLIIEKPTLLPYYSFIADFINLLSTNANNLYNELLPLLSVPKLKMKKC